VLPLDFRGGSSNEGEDEHNRRFHSRMNTTAWTLLSQWVNQIARPAAFP
jgi:hypothetical protein